VLPPAPCFTLADVIVASTFASILLAALAIVVMQAAWKKRPALARATNRILALVTIAGFFGANGAMITRAVGCARCRWTSPIFPARKTARHWPRPSSPSRPAAPASRCPPPWWGG
jgi:hypothetical protein